MQKYLKVLRWTAAAAMLLAAVLLTWQCIDIYIDGNSPENLDANGLHINPVYSWENVGERLIALAVPLTACMLIVLIALGCHVVRGGGDSQGRSGITPENRLRLMKARVAELPEAASAEERNRRMLVLGVALCLLIDAALCLAYLLDGSNFSSWDLETVVGNMMLHVAPLVAIAFGFVIAASFVWKASVEREIAVLKDAPKAAPVPEKEKKHMPLNPVRIALYALAVLFIVLGVMNGGLRDVLYKAINICTECIGLG